MNLETVRVNTHEIKVEAVIAGTHEKKGPFQKIVWTQKAKKNFGTSEAPILVDQAFTAEAKTFKMHQLKVGDVIKAKTVEINQYEMDNGKTYYGLEALQ